MAKQSLTFIIQI